MYTFHSYITYLPFRTECSQSPTLCTEPLSRQITGPRADPTILILLNAHNITHFPNDLFLCHRLVYFLGLIREASFATDGN